MNIDQLGAQTEKIGQVTAGAGPSTAPLDLLQPVVRKIRRRGTIHVVEGADHSFHVLKRSGRYSEDVLDEFADAVARFTTTGH